MIKVLGNRVLVKPEEEVKKTSSGIILANELKSAHKVGIVRGVGSGRILDNGEKTAIDLKVGDKVIYSTFSGTEVEIDKVSYIILNAEDIMAEDIPNV